eukprot:1769658-Prymnesium_polylepis.1
MSCGCSPKPLISSVRQTGGEFIRTGCQRLRITSGLWIRCPSHMCAHLSMRYYQREPWRTASGLWIR